MRPYAVVWLVGWLVFQASCEPVLGKDRGTIELGLSKKDYKEGRVPDGWKLRRPIFPRAPGSARWVKEEGVAAVRLQSKAALTFLEKTVDIDLRKYPVVSWQWKVANVLDGIDETTKEGDDHPIRIFFVFEPDSSAQNPWFRIKRFLYLDWAHGHPMGGRFTEYLWSSHLPKGEVFNDPGKSMQKLMVAEGGTKNLGRWLSYEKNLYEDFKTLYGEDPRRLVFIGILNDTDQTGQEAVSYIKDLVFRAE